MDNRIKEIRLLLKENSVLLGFWHSEVILRGNNLYCYMIRFNKSSEMANGEKYDTIRAYYRVKIYKRKEMDILLKELRKENKILKKQSQ